MRKNIFCSVSFGRSSVATALHLATHPKYRDCNILYAFANTSMEHEETLKFGHSLSDFLKIFWIEGTYPMLKGVGIGYRVVSFETAKRKGEVFEAMMAKANIPTTSGNTVGLPNVATPYCSDRLKKIPLHKFAKDYFKGEKYVTAIGFRKEDIEISRRLSWAEVRDSEDYMFPLLTDFKEPLSNIDVHRIIEAAGYTLGIDSKTGNCTICPKRNEKKIVNMIKENMIDIHWVREQELKYKDRFYRGNKSILDLIELAKNPCKQITLFEDEEACMCGI